MHAKRAGGGAHSQERMRTRTNTKRRARASFGGRVRCACLRSHVHLCILAHEATACYRTSFVVE
eukprot:1146767-Pleurochrysis_carterae.AAC.1